MFRRAKTDAPSTEADSPAAEAPTGRDPSTSGPKGRPTPTRKEAQAAAKARAKVPRDRKEQGRAKRARRSEAQQTVRRGMRTGEERFLPARDRGPVRRFLRDRIDSRVSAAEFLLPALILIMVLIYSSVPELVSIGNGLWLATLLIVAVDTALLLVRVRGELRTKHPDESHRGWIGYALLRVMQLRFLRMPKPQVKIGGEKIKR